MAKNNSSKSSYLTHEEILYFLFCNKNICTNPNFSIETILLEINKYRESPFDIKTQIDTLLKWNQHYRQLREMLNVLQYASNLFENKSGKISLNISDSKDLEFIKDIINYKKINFLKLL